MSSQRSAWGACAMAGAAAWRGGDVVGPATGAVGDIGVSVLPGVAALPFASAAAFATAAAFAASAACAAAAAVSAAGAAGGVCCDDMLLSDEPAGVPLAAVPSLAASAAGGAGAGSVALFESVVVTVSFGSAGNSIL